ncbi:hypothetical protein [Allohahella sp. A8]|uniref:hypothetical protein n=1 Tax=Allohahella sp. A8 TaxID=3141461 RepID=UPI000C09324E|nr:hypothetical protein [Hahellaceae bacterium]|tara:strand:+ start:49590 stop:50438 length:849 start_codon:yes stop_codon:yes gene_type:complete
MKHPFLGYSAGAAALAFGGLLWLIADRPPTPAMTTDAILHSDAATTGEPAVVASPHPAQTSLPEPARRPPAVAVTDPQPDLLLQPDVNPDYPTFQDRVTEVSVRRNNRDFDPQALWVASQRPEAWQALEAPSQNFGLSAEEMQDGREFINIDPLKIESLVPGDTLELPIAQLNTTLVAQIDEVRSEDNGRNVTWTGEILGLDAPNQITLTRGGDLIMAGISTPDGVYELQAHGSEGWIANGATLFKGQDQQIVVPPELIENPPTQVVHLEPETFGDHAGHNH